MSERPPPPKVPGLPEAVLEAAENAGLGVAVVRVGPELRVLYLSAKAAEILGRPTADEIALTKLEVIVERDRDRLAARVEARRRGAAPDPMLETVITRPDGTEIPVELGIAPVLVEGAPTSVVFLRDLRPRKRAEESLRRSEARLRALIESAPDGIVMFREGRIVYANPAAAALLGVDDAARLVGSSLREFLHPDDFEVMVERVGRLAATGGPQGPYEYRVRAEDGRALVVEVTSIMFDDEAGHSVVGFARDVTESRRLQAQLMRADRMAALGTMAAGVAHEINNPLAFMMLGLDSIERRLDREEPDRDAIRSTIADVRHGVDRVAAIVRQLRVFSRHDGDPSRGVVDVHAVVESAAKMAAHELRQYGRLELDVPDDLPPVRGDATQLEQVFLNLLLNAAHALDGSGVIHVVARERGDAVEAIVTDDGSGIDEADLGRIFDPFFTTKPVGAGTGLGLAVCHSIVTGLGGAITAESAPGRGTAVHLSLPLVRRALSPPTPPDAVRRRRIGQRLSVLAADDEPEFLRAVERVLAADHDVVTADGGEAAWARILEAPPDVILLDVVMPDVSGIELFERIRRERPALVERVAFVTGGSARPQVDRFVAKAGRPTLEKPFDAERLAQLIRRIGRSRL